MALSKQWHFLDIYIGAWRNLINIGVYVYKIMTFLIRWRFKTCHCKIRTTLAFVTSVIISSICITGFLGTCSKGHYLPLDIYTDHNFPPLTSFFHEPISTWQTPICIGKLPSNFINEHIGDHQKPTNDHQQQTSDDQPLLKNFIGNI